MLVGKHILLVEDEALVTMLVEETLRDAGAEVPVAATVTEALRSLLKRRSMLPCSTASSVTNL